MAQIVNDAAPIPQNTLPEPPKAEEPVDPRAGLDTAGIQALLRKKRKSLYDHVPFKSLYEYSETIGAIRALSKTAITKHIEAHKAYWQTLHSRVKTFVGMDTTSPLFSNGGTIQYAKNVDGYGVYTVPITDPREQHNETEIDIEFSVVSSIIHITDPYNGICMTKDACERMAKQLGEYIAVGLYPVVNVPMDFRSMMSSADKYGTVARGGDDVGIIVDLQMERVGEDDGEDSYYLFGTVLWNPQSYTISYGPSMYGCFSGIIEMIDTTKAPSAWNPINDVCNLMAPGIPVFEFRPNTMALQTLVSNHELQDLVNTAMVTGQVTFDFVVHLMAKIKNMTEQIAAASAARPTVPGPKHNVPAEVKPDKVPTEPAPVPAYEGNDDEVPVEDASQIDDVGRRMRLYDKEGGDEGDPEPIYNAFIGDDLDD